MDRVKPDGQLPASGGRRVYHARAGVKWDAYLKMRAAKHASTYKPTYPARYEDNLKVPVK